MIYRMGPALTIVETPSDKPRYYTDDTQMAIGVAETLVECGGINEEALCEAFGRNYDPARSYGQGARRIIEAMIAGRDCAAWPGRFSPAIVGQRRGHARCAVGLMFCDDLDQVATEAELSARPTHVHPLAMDGAGYWHCRRPGDARYSVCPGGVLRRVAEAREDGGISVAAFCRRGTESKRWSERVRQQP